MEITREQAFLLKEHIYRVFCQGSDSQMSRRLRSFMKDPRRCPLYGTDQSWGISSSLYFGIPRGLDPLISEAWLWRLGLRRRGAYRKLVVGKNGDTCICMEEYWPLNKDISYTALLFSIPLLAPSI